MSIRRPHILIALLAILLPLLAGCNPAPVSGTMFSKNVQALTALTQEQRDEVNKKAVTVFCTFKAVDIVDPQSVTLSLKNRTDAVSKYVMTKAAPADVAILDAYKVGSEVSPGILQSVLNALNNVVEDPALYEAQRFSAFKLPDKLVDSATGKLTGLNLAELNITLLQTAYGKTLKMVPGTPDRLAQVGSIFHDVSLMVPLDSPGAKAFDDQAKLALDSAIKAKLSNSDARTIEVQHREVLSRMDQRNKGQIAYKVLDAIVAATGRNREVSYALAMILLALFVKVITNPLQKASMQGMKEMQRMQPEVAKLKERFKGEELNTKMMELYKEHKVNPAKSCLPMLIQFPIMIYIYNSIRLYEFQFSNGNFLWIRDSSLSDLYPHMVASNLGKHDVLLLVLYSISMFISQRLTPVSDPAQAEQQKQTSLMMTVMITFMMFSWNFPSAFVLYWLVFNVLNMWQQWQFQKDAAAELAVSGGAAVVNARPAPKPRKKK